MKKLKLVAMSMTIGLIFVVAQGFFNPAFCKTIKLKAVSFMFADGAENVTLKMLIDKVSQKTNGQVKIDWLGGPEIVSEFEQTGMVAKGVFDMGYNSASYYAGDVPGAELMLASTHDIKTLRNNGFWDEFGELHKDANLFLLGNGWECVEQWNIMINKPLDGLDDLRGLKLGDGTVGLRFLKKVKASSVTLGIEDVFTALDRGVADGIIWPRSLGAAVKIQESVKYIVEHGFFRGDLVFVVNLKKWRKIPKNLQDAMLEAALEVEEASRVPSARENDGAYVAMDEGGVKRIRFSKSEANKMLDMIYQSEWDQAMERYPDIAQRLIKYLK